MKILWLINIALPEVSELLNEKVTPFGGWLVNVSKQVSEATNATLDIAFPKNDVDTVTEIKGSAIRYFAFPPLSLKNKSSLHDNKELAKVVSVSNPDIVHIFGSEFAHTLAMVNVCKNRIIPFTVSVQGLVSIIPRHYTLGIPKSVQKRFTFRDFIRQDNITQQKNKFIKRGELEVEAFEKSEHVIGRTTWDKACTFQINPNIKYHLCNENLRDEFYLNEWTATKIEEHSIFISQGSYPLKGLHFMIEALTILAKQFTDVRLYIGGDDITKSKTAMDKLKISSYGKYIKELIQSHDLQDRVVFTGTLNEVEMCHRFLKSNVFVCPSTIENSPNSLGEAMVLGVPCVASDVGGISDLLSHKVEGFLYPSDAPYMLAYYIGEILSNKELAMGLSENAKTRAKKTHDRKRNMDRLFEIYSDILSAEPMKF